MQPEGVGESAEASEEDEEPGTEQRPSTPTRGGEQNSSRVNSPGLLGVLNQRLEPDRILDPGF